MALSEGIGNGEDRDAHGGDRDARLRRGAGLLPWLPPASSQRGYPRRLRACGVLGLQYHGFAPAPAPLALGRRLSHRGLLPPAASSAVTGCVCCRSLATCVRGECRHGEATPGAPVCFRTCGARARTCMDAASRSGPQAHREERSGTADSSHLEFRCFEPPSRLGPRTYKCRVG